MLVISETELLAYYVWEFLEQAAAIEPIDVTRTIADFYELTRQERNNLIRRMEESSWNL